MTDRELLELAAKAAGIEGTWEIDTSFIQEHWYFNVPYNNHGMITGSEWNPLTDDGDAFRLAVKLKIEISHGEECNQVCAAYPNQFVGINYTIEDYTSDPYTAARRSIVRAAAEIGKLK